MKSLVLTARSAQADGKFLCDPYQPDYLHLENGGDIVDTASIPDNDSHIR